MNMTLKPKNIKEKEYETHKFQKISAIVLFPNLYTIVWLFLLKQNIIWRIVKYEKMTLFIIIGTLTTLLFGCGKKMR